MNGRIALRVLLALVLIAGLAGLGVWVYNAGVAQGLAQTGQLVAPDGGGRAVGPYYGYYPPFGFGFGLFGFFIPLLFRCLVFGLLRLIFWRGRPGWGWRGHGDSEYWKDHVPPMVEEWHRRMHESQSAGK